MKLFYYSIKYGYFAILTIALIIIIFIPKVPILIPILFVFSPLIMIVALWLIAFIYFFFKHYKNGRLY